MDKKQLLDELDTIILKLKESGEEPPEELNDLIEDINEELDSKKEEEGKEIEEDKKEKLDKLR